MTSSHSRFWIDTRVSQSLYEISMSGSSSILGKLIVVYGVFVLLLQERSIETNFFICYSWRTLIGVFVIRLFMVEYINVRNDTSKKVVLSACYLVVVIKMFVLFYFWIYLFFWLKLNIFIIMYLIIFSRMYSHTYTFLIHFFLWHKLPIHKYIHMTWL